MIKLTSLNGHEIFLNCDLIEHMESKPDTVIVLMTGNKMIVKESPEDILQGIINFKQQCFKNVNKLFN